MNTVLIMMGRANSGLQRQATEQSDDIFIILIYSRPMDATLKKYDPHYSMETVTKPKFIPFVIVYLGGPS